MAGTGRRNPGVDTLESNGWPVGPALPDLHPDGVHVWRTSLDVSPERLEWLTNILAPDEVTRADSFRRADDRRRYIVARGTLRELLGRYIEGAPQRVRLIYEAEGKPALAGTGEPRFNLAHSGDMALYAFARGTPVGIDVEEIRKRDVLAVADHFFTDGERAALRDLPPTKRLLAFYDCWTRKEALLKALGQGLGENLAELDTGGLSDGTELSIDWIDGQPACWMLLAVDAGARYRATLALPPGPWAFSCWTFQ